MVNITQNMIDWEEIHMSKDLEQLREEIRFKEQAVSWLERLCAHLGASPADAMALGDTYNDIPMLKVAGHSYVVANAEEHMRAHARFVAPSNNERGVAQVIDAGLAAQRR